MPFRESKHQEIGFSRVAGAESSTVPKVFRAFKPRRIGDILRMG